MKKKTFLFLILGLLIPIIVFSFQTMQMSFNSGELSPRLFGRVDLAKYYSGLETCLNSVVMPHGGVTRRTGFEFIATAEQTTTETILIPFEFSTEQAYILEFGDKTMRVYADGGQVLDAVDTDTKLLVHADGTHGSTIFTDDGNTGHTLTPSGDASISTAQLKFGTGSAVFDGTDDKITAPAHADWDFGTDDFTIDFWAKRGGGNAFTEEHIIGTRDPNNTGTSWTLYYNRTAQGWYFHSFTVADDASFSLDITADTNWHHYAVVRSGTDWYWFYDGVEQVLVLDGIGGANLEGGINLLTVGSYISVSTRSWNGYIDELRVSKGVARWVSGFTPPTAPYSISIEGGDPFKLASPFSEGHLADLKYVQSADVLYFAHNSYPPYKLSRTAHTEWTFTEIDFDWPPFQDINTTSTTLNPSATTGVINITSSLAGLIATEEIGSHVMFGGNGYVEISSITSNTVFVATVEETLPGSAATTDWHLSSWGGDRGYPGALTFFEERLIYAGSIGEAQTVWMGQSGDFENHFISTDEVIDSDAIIYTIAADQVNAIKWLYSTKKLLLGTTGGEWWTSGSDSLDPITPTNIIVRRETTYGSEGLQPVFVDNSVLFLQRGGKKIRGFSYDFESDSYLGSDLSLLSDFTRNNKIISMAYQQYPYQIIWCVRDDGDLLGLTYMKAQEVVGWHQHTTQGDFKWVASIPGDNEDELWAVVSRKTPTSPIVTIERLFETFSGEDMKDAFYVDSGLIYNGSEATTLSGLDHLIGTTVEVLADGAVQDATLVQASGIIGLNPSASKASVGLKYMADIKTLRLAGGESGELQGRQKHISFATIRLFETLGISMGIASEELDVLEFSATDELFTGDFRFSFPSEVDTEGQMFIRQDNPQPMTILSIIPEFEVYD